LNKTKPYLTENLQEQHPLLTEHPDFQTCPLIELTWRLTLHLRQQWAQCWDNKEKKHTFCDLGPTKRLFNYYVSTYERYQFGNYLHEE
jgi:hypothetical protein